MNSLTILGKWIAFLWHNLCWTNVQMVVSQAKLNYIYLPWPFTTAVVNYERTPSRQLCYAHLFNIQYGKENLGSNGVLNEQTPTLINSTSFCGLKTVSRPSTTNPSTLPGCVALQRISDLSWLWLNKEYQHVSYSFLIRKQKLLASSLTYCSSRFPQNESFLATLHQWHVWLRRVTLRSSRMWSVLLRMG